MALVYQVCVGRYANPSAGVMVRKDVLVSVMHGRFINEGGGGKYFDKADKQTKKKLRQKNK